MLKLPIATHLQVIAFSLWIFYVVEYFCGSLLYDEYNSLFLLTVCGSLLLWDVQYLCLDVQKYNGAESLLRSWEMLSRLLNFMEYEGQWNNFINNITYQR